MSYYRFLPHKGLRQKGETYKEFFTSFDELDEEEFDDREQFCQAIASRIYNCLNEKDDEQDVKED